MTDERSGGASAPDSDDPSVSLDVLTEEILPALIARLRASRLGELEIRSRGWRVRLRRDGAATASGGEPTGLGADGDGPPEIGASGVARSPAVGYFSPAPGLVIGHTVQAGDPLGSVDVLGIVQDVSAPTGGIVSEVLAEAGQAVEFGQALAVIDPLLPESAAGSDAGAGSGSPAAAD